MRTTFNIALVALIFSGLFTSCKTTEDIATTESTPVESTKDEIVSETLPAAEDEVAQVEDTIERSFFASILRSPCFGTCPTYKMVIYDDGFVELEGTAHIDMIGKYTGKLTEAQVQNFRIRAQRTGFMDMKDSYDGAISDVPSATSTIVLDGVRKSVYRRFDYPRAILQFEALFDELLESQKWTKVD